MTIGIPRAFIYYKRRYFWENFFESLGFKVILSPISNKEIVKRGVEISDSETCFSQKVYFGHLLWLQKKCDFIFVPRLKAKKMEGSCRKFFEYCPKFFGIPDLAKIVSKTPILEETFDERKEKFEKSLENLGKKLKKEKKEIKKAQKFALLKEKEIQKKEKEEFQKKILSRKIKIVVISHPYNFYDSYINLGLKEKLEKLGAEVLFIEEVPQEKSKTKTFLCKKHVLLQEPKVIDFHWEFGKEIMEKISEILKYKINGGVEISSFQCGCDAVLKEFVEQQFNLKKIPFLYLLIDEHTGEAGFQTRLEAFIDTL